MDKHSPAHASLTDIFETVLRKTTQAAPDRPPIITVNGNGNVLAWGGTVHLKQAAVTGSNPPPPQPE
jgi:hypothetical protein